MGRRKPSVKQRGVSFSTSAKDAGLIRKIARRARDILLSLQIDREALDIRMDLAATHANGCPLDFERMLAADDFNLMHDIGGIARHLDRSTGKLDGRFSPRFTLRDEKAA
ncbi:hypothetical protein AB7M49_007015 [Bradyrhizobium elkanii]